jgi:hypothetical protein
VYGRILKPRAESYLDQQVHLYVDSASKYGFGLEGRKQQHLSKSKRLHSPRLRSLIRKSELGRRAHFITFMTFGLDSGEKEDVLRVRCLVTLAEAIFTVWLDAFAENMEDRGDLGDRCYQGRSLPYSGGSSHNPLTEDIMIPRDDLITARLSGTNGVQEQEKPDLVWYTDWLKRVPARSETAPSLAEQEGDMPPFGLEVVTRGVEYPSTTTKLRSESGNTEIRDCEVPADVGPWKS